MNNFGNFLSEKRKEAGLTQKELASKLFISESAISKWEKNKSNPDISMIGELSKILNVTEHELLTASVDLKERRTQVDAKRWRTLSITWNLFFIISYSITVLTCFICNLAVSGTLSWFFIVLSSIVLAMSFTTFPRYIKRYKLFLTTVIELICLIILFLVCCIYTNGKWFYLSTVPCVFAFVVVFLPLYIKEYNLPKYIKEHNAIICIVIDILFLILTLFTVNKEVDGNWFDDFALPLALFVSVIPIIFVVVCRYINIGKLLKASILTFIFLPFSLIGYFITKKLCLLKFNIEIDKITIADFYNWSSDIAIRSNVFAIISLSILLVSLTLFGFYIIKRSKEKDE